MAAIIPIKNLLTNLIVFSCLVAIAILFFKSQKPLALRGTYKKDVCLD